MGGETERHLKFKLVCGTVPCMEHEYWHNKWAANDIGFHKSAPHADLVSHWHTLQLPPQSSVFVPLCGKSHDIDWLLEANHRVVGAELNEPAIQALFDGLSLTPDVQQDGELTRYHSGNLTVYVGDVFLVTAKHLHTIDAVYDRAALVALPPGMRERYTQHLLEVTHEAPQLLITFDYDQTTMQGPPHSVPEDEVRSHYGQSFMLNKLSEAPVEGKLKGKTPAMEVVWHLSR